MIFLIYRKMFSVLTALFLKGETLYIYISTLDLIVLSLHIFFLPALKSSASFHEQRRSLERARTEDYLKRKIRSRPERSELVRMHILEETSAEPSLQAKQLLLKRARLADDLNDKISQRPGPMELIHKNILPVHSSLKQAIIGTKLKQEARYSIHTTVKFSPQFAV
uniref:Phosphatase and actin regulator n=1 Tax=Sinocyclocheilus rhinocerous TaxID=307959 RepID=A0A673JNU3_9TELE